MRPVPPWVGDVGHGDDVELLGGAATGSIDGEQDGESDDTTHDTDDDGDLEQTQQEVAVERRVVQDIGVGHGPEVLEPVAQPLRHGRAAGLCAQARDERSRLVNALEPRPEDEEDDKVDDRDDQDGHQGRDDRRGRGRHGARIGGLKRSVSRWCGKSHQAGGHTVAALSASVRETRPLTLGVPMMSAMMLARELCNSRGGSKSMALKRGVTGLLETWRVRDRSLWWREIDDPAVSPGQRSDVRQINATRGAHDDWAAIASRDMYDTIIIRRSIDRSLIVRSCIADSIDLYRSL
nr:hypothetical protein CFP56_12076 [Quercus suber]